MATVPSTSITVFFFFFILLTSAPSPSQSVSFSTYFRYRNFTSLSHSLLTAVANHRTARGSQSVSFSTYFRYRNFTSISHSLLTAVANHRAARGDLAGADRVRAIADMLHEGTVFGFLKLPWTLSWMELSFTDLYRIVSDMNELLRCLTELTRLESVTERLAWVSRNYQNVLTVSKSLARKDVLREIEETFQKEVVEGRLIRDCLELGNDDLNFEGFDERNRGDVSDGQEFVVAILSCS